MIDRRELPGLRSQMLLSLGLFGGVGSPSNDAGRKMRTVMRTYYFDIKDGVPSRDRKGIEFSTAASAIEHSRELARRLRSEPRLRDPDLSIVVIDESGAEIHREAVHPAAARPANSLNNIG